MECGKTVLFFAFAALTAAGMRRDNNGMTTTGPNTQTITLAPDLLRQAEQRAAQMNVSRDRIIEMALTDYLTASSPSIEDDAEDTRYLRAIRSKQARALARADDHE